MTSKRYISKRESRRRQKRRNVRIVSMTFFVLMIAVLGAILINRHENSTHPNPDNLRTRFPAEITIETTYQYYQAGSYVLDVREQEEWERLHIPGTVNIPLNQLSERLLEIPYDEEIFVICDSGNRSLEARDFLLRQGFPNVASVQGGITAWREKGYPIEGNQP